MVTCRVGISRTGSADCINLINKDNSRRFLAGKREQFADKPGAFSDILLNKLRCNNADKRSMRLMCRSLCQKRLSRTRRTVEKNTFRRFDSGLLKELRL